MRGQTGAPMTYDKSLSNKRQKYLNSRKANCKICIHNIMSRCEYDLTPINNKCKYYYYSIEKIKLLKKIEKKNKAKNKNKVKNKNKAKNKNKNRKK